MADGTNSVVDNYLSGLMWRLTRSSEYVVRGLRRAGFSGGWLEGAPRT